MLDYSLEYTKICFWCDNISAINLSKNSIQHLISKHIDVKHHFIRDHAQKGNTELKFFKTRLQLFDILTKPLIGERFKFLKSLINVKCLTDL